MLDYNTMQIVQQTVYELVQSGKQFTAHDVTCAVRNKVGRSINVAHSDVKQEVHTLFANNQLGVTDYTRSLGNFPGANPQPWIYHKINDNPVVVDNTLLITDHTDDSDDAVNVTKDGTYKVDGRGTLCLPVSLLRAAGMKVGDVAAVFSDTILGSVVVVNSNVNMSSVYDQLSMYAVDKYGNVRITQGTLHRGGIGGKEYNVVGDSNFVTITKVS